MSQRLECQDASVKSAGRVLDILMFLSGVPQPVPAMTIARSCGIPRSSVYELLGVLRDRGFVHHIEGDRLWGLGLAARSVEAGMNHRRSLSRLAMSVLRSLSMSEDGAAFLDVLEHGDVVRVATACPDGCALPATVCAADIRHPAHLSATGIALLAQQTSAQVDALLPDTTMWLSRTGRGPRTRREVFDVLTRTRGAGFAWEEGWIDRSVSTLGVAVFDHSESAVAAVGLTRWAVELDDPVSKAKGVLAVRAAASNLAVRLGGAARPEMDRSAAS